MGLGFVSTITPIPFIAWFYLVLGTAVPFVLNKRKVDDGLAFFIVYLVSFEILARMVKTSPIIPYEMGKYLLFSGLIYGILKGHSKGKIGFLLVLLLIPALFYDLSGEVRFLDLVFNVLGPINIGLAIVYFSRQKFTLMGLQSLLRLATYPLLAALVFVFIKTPDYEDIQFSLSANFNTTGGFGSNQVSTAFGLGMLFMFVFLINRWTFSGKWYVDALFLLGFAFQGLLSFSRGGMIGGFLGIGIIIFFIVQMKPFLRNRYNLPKIGKYAIPGIIVLLVSFWMANNITGGNLLLRYQGETEGTLRGTREKSLDILTTGRFNIFLGDLRLFEENIIFGVGGGASRYLRDTAEGVITHVEFSRLLSEHGILGIMFLLVLVWVMIIPLKDQKNPLLKAVFFSLAVLAVYSTFHAATRTYITPLLMGLSTIYIVYGQGPVSRK